MRDLVDTIGTRIREHEGHIYIPDLYRDRVKAKSGGEPDFAKCARDGTWSCIIISC